jgi:hypothetical protein
LGLSSTTDKQKEAAWRVEFEALGEQLVFRNVQRSAIHNDEAKRQAALRWLSERDRTAQLGWLAFFVAIAGVLISIIALVVGRSIEPARPPLPAALVYRRNGGRLFCDAGLLICAHNRPTILAQTF